MKHVRLFVIVLTLLATAAVAMDARLRLRLSVWLHNLLRHRSYFSLALDMSRRGVLAVSRERDFTPYGFTRPVRWVDVPARDVAQKRDALPVHVIEMLLPRSGFLGRRRVGTSLFIEDNRDGQRVARRDRYLQAMIPSVAEKTYTRVIRRELARAETGDEDTLQERAQRVCACVTLRLHVLSAPTDVELSSCVQEAALDMMNALTVTLNGALWIPRGVARARKVLRRFLRSATPESLVGRWLAAGMSIDDAFAEFAHNLFGMALQWTYVLLRLWKREAVGILTSPLAAARFLLLNPPALVAASRTADGALALHDLQAMCQRALHEPLRYTVRPGCPFALVNDGDDLVHRDGISGVASYAVFGHGERRCPGEWITYLFVMEASRLSRPPLRDEPRRIGLHFI